MKKLDYELQNARDRQHRLLVYGKGRLASINELFSFAHGRLTAVSEDRGDTHAVLLDLEDISEDMRCVEVLSHSDAFKKVHATAYHVECYLKGAIYDIRDHGLKNLDEYISNVKVMTYPNANLLLPDQAY